MEAMKKTFTPESVTVLDCHRTIGALNAERIRTVA